MDKLFLYRYAATYEDVHSECGTDLYRLEKHYYTKGLPNSRLPTFDPLQWMAGRAADVFSGKDCKCIVYNSRTPKCVLVGDMPIVRNNWISGSMLENITLIALSMGTEFRKFDADAYYAMHHSKIDAYARLHSKADVGDEERALLFYICYGFWNGIACTKPDILSYICSYGDILETVGANEDLGAFKFYNEPAKITFDPYTYVASNYHSEDLVKECVNAVGDIDAARACKHYIRHGYHNKLPTDAFDHWEYLSNNHRRIKKLLHRLPNNKIDYDVVQLSKSVVAQDYIRRRKKAKSDRFCAAKFLKAYIDDETVNADRGLRLENAAEYFVKYYILCERVRYELTLTNKIVLFAQGRLFDSVRQIPFNATRYIIENKCI